MSINLRKAQGFTIVELLIAIVVIAILAAISIVAYNGIQNRANDSAVQSDLRNLAAKVMEYQAINSTYPLGGGVNGPAAMKFSVSRGAYATDSHNFVYCTNGTTGTAPTDKFIVVGRSKSGTRFAYSSDKGMYTYTQSWGGVNDVCSNEGYDAIARSYSYGYLNNGASSTWHPWTE